MKHNFLTRLCTWLCIAVLSVTLLSCATKKRALNELRNLSTEIENNSTSYDLTEWREVAEKFIQINKKIKDNKSKYSADERNEIEDLRGRCIGLFVTNIISGAKDKVSGTIKGVEGLLQGIRKVLEK